MCGSAARRLAYWRWGRAGGGGGGERRLLFWLVGGRGRNLGVRVVFCCRGHHVGIHTSNFRDFLLKPELLRAVVDCGFENPSEGV
jgi:hypothetical protein